MPQGVAANNLKTLDKLAQGARSIEMEWDLFNDDDTCTSGHIIIFAEVSMFSEWSRF